MKEKVNYILILSFFLLGLTVSCAESPEPTRFESTSPVPIKTKQPYYDWKIDWLNNPMCHPPCWEGITPGQTTTLDAINLIQAMPNVKMGEVSRNFFEWAGIKSYTAVAFADESGSVIQFLSIHFQSSHEFDLGEAISVLGNPESLQVHDCSEGGCDVTLLYPERGFALEISLLPIDNILIEKTSQIQGLVFFVPGLENYFKLVPFKDIPVLHWRGYGVYSE